VRYLIDTHILLWYIVGDRRVSLDIIERIENINNDIYISNASLWEIAIKVSIGKLSLKGSLLDLKNFLAANSFNILEFDFDDLEVLLSLPFYHQDPFDRIIISQSLSKSLEIITNDNQIQKYFA
jgi:PIN domain nuclease of toxin-antitoxin system